MLDVLCEQEKELLGRLIGLARGTEGNEHMITESTAAAVVDGLVTLSSHRKQDIPLMLDRAREEKRKLVPDCFLCASPCGRTADYEVEKLGRAPEDIRVLKCRILTRAEDLAVLIRRRGGGAHPLLYRALIAVAIDEFGQQELLPIERELEAACV